MARQTVINQRADYGLDAPKAIRKLLVIAAVGLLATGAWGAGIWPLRFRTIRALTPVLIIGLDCLLMAGWMIWYSKVGKLRERVRLLDHLVWRGDEKVLDVGCGRGLLVNEAARRLRTGKAVGIDLWRKDDLSGNGPQAALVNAEIEGVADRVETTAGDARSLPFAEGTFDVVLSSLVLHNIEDANQRRQAVREIVRVLKPGGQVIISDIQHKREYARVLQEHGFPNVVRIRTPVWSVVMACLSMGAVRISALVARKP